MYMGWHGILLKGFALGMTWEKGLRLGFGLSSCLGEGLVSDGLCEGTGGSAGCGWD